MESFEVVMVGAGLSGINCAYRVQNQAVGTCFTVLEDRAELGGIWDVFRFPGVRSDPDLCSLGFQWHPWPYQQPFAEGSLIMEYIKDAVNKHGLMQHIQFQQKVISANWSSDSQSWQLIVDNQGQTRHVVAKFFVLGTGYINFSIPFPADIPGLDTFKGKTIHPQFWPSQYNYDNQKVAIIGSGATAVTMLPRLAEHAAQVTMVQRSPTYVGIAPNSTPISALAKKIWPLSWVAVWERFYHTLFFYVLGLVSRKWPQTAKNTLQKAASDALPKDIKLSPHFEPRYMPGEQRVCLAPDGDFFAALHRENTHIVTGEIDTVTGHGIQMRDGTLVDVDVIITATGMKMRLGGDIDLQVDGESVSWAKRPVWNGVMLDGVPNLVYMLGYSNGSFTLGADAAARILVRILQHMHSTHTSSATPHASKDAVAETKRVWPLDSTYRLAVENELPVYGTKGPWKPARISPFADYVHARWGSVTKDLEFRTTST